MREKDYYGAIKGFCLKWNLPEVWNSDRITGANLIYEVIKVINAMIIELREYEDQVDGKLDEMKKMIDEFLRMFDEDLSETVRLLLVEWKDSGILDGIINDALFNQKLDKSVFEDYLVEELKNFTLIKPEYNTLEIQSILDNVNNNNFIWLSGVYTLSPIFFKSNQTHSFNPNVLIKSDISFTDGMRLLNIIQVKDIVLNFNGAKVQMNNETPNEHGGSMHCLSINGSENIIIKDVILSESGGDGVYIGHSQDNKPSINVTLENIQCLNNARQGISITDVKGCYINNVLIDGVRGGNPASGIDIEPNNPRDFIENIVIENVVIRNTENAGVLIALPYLASNPNGPYPDQYNEVSITLRNFDIENVKLGIHFYHLYDEIGGYINIDNFNIRNTLNQGILFDGWYKDMIPDLNIRNITIDNVNMSSKTQAYDSSGIVLNNYLSRKNKVVGGFTIENLKIIETNEVKKMRYTIYGQNLHDSHCELNLLNTNYISNGLIETVTFKGLLRYFNSIKKINKNIDITSQINFNYILPEKITKNNESTVSYIINGGFVGNSIEFVNNSDSELRIRAVEGLTLDDLINDPGNVVNNYVSNTKGSSIKIKMINETTFTVVEKEGIWLKI